MKINSFNPKPFINTDRKFFVKCVKINTLRFAEVYPQFALFPNSIGLTKIQINVQMCLRYEKCSAILSMIR